MLSIYNRDQIWIPIFGCVSKFFFWFMSFVFDKLAPLLNKRFKNMLSIIFQSIPMQKTVLKVLKRAIFFICILFGKPMGWLHFWL